MVTRQSFDYVIVGGGSAGSVLANRLSEDPSVTVCLIEAGPPDRDPRIKVPLGVMALMGNKKFDWRYKSEPHQHLGGRQVSVPRGKTLGGSGSINSMVYIRGRASDYNAWAEEGCEGWDWNTVLQRFVRQENNARFGNSPLHGNDGPLFVEDLPSPSPMVQRLVDAGHAVGIPQNDDFNGERQEGLGNYQVTMHRGRRWSPADAFIRPALERSNLTVMTDTLADRIEFTAQRATSLHVQRNREAARINVRGELLLAAGAIGSPAILLRSGIGPTGELDALDIPVILELSGVGANLHDHPAVGMHYGGGKHGYALSMATMPQNMLAPFRYLLARKGLFSSNTVEGGGFARTLDSLAEPDVQFHFIPARVGHDGKALTWGRGYYCDVCLLKPESRGRLRLRSRDPTVAPSIDLNLLNTAADRDTLTRGASLLRRMLAQPSLKTGDATELVPGDSVQSDEELHAFIEGRLGTAYHPVGTCRMGNSGDQRSVVDPELNVIGLDNVRVADASIMPEIVAGNTNAPTMMIADRAADFIQARRA